MTNLATRAAADLALPQSLAEIIERTPYPVGFGTAWIQMHGSFFNPATHAGVVKPPETFTTYADLDAAWPIQPLCRPVTRPVEGPVLRLLLNQPSKVVGVALPWVVMDNAGTLLAWRCGSPTPEILSTDASSAQLGAGIVTWVTREGTGSGVANAERLDTGRHWQWSGPYPFAEVVHTANALYGRVFCGGSCPAFRLVKTSLRGL